MSTDVFPFAVWLSGTNENSIPANDNSLRNEVLSNGAIDFADVEPSPSSDGRDIYVISTSWGGFSVGDVVIYVDGAWYGFLPFEGWVKTINGSLYMYTAGDWEVISAGASAMLRNDVTALSISSGSVTVDWSSGDYFTLSMTGNVTSLLFSNLPGSGKASSLAIKIVQDATGGRTLTLPSSFKAITGSDTAIQSAANAITILMITTFDNGTRWEYSMKAGAA